MKKPAVLPVLLMVGALLSSSVLAESTVPTVFTPPGALKPGQTLVIEFQSGQKKAPTLLMNREEIPFYKSNRGPWRALARVPLDQAPGEMIISVRGKTGFWGKEISIPAKVSILESEFYTETIQFPEEKARLLNDPSEDEESRLFRQLMAENKADPVQRWRGTFGAPVEGDLISPYGITRKKIGQDGLDFHRGVDQKAKLGEPILAPAGGEVLLAKSLKFHGKTVLLNHGQGISSIFIHMDQLSVKEGQKIEKGQKLGEAGSTGLATAPHLHWGVYIRGQAVDPLQWLEVAF